MEEQKQIVEMNQTQQPPWMINNLALCYMGERCNGNDNERKQHFLQHKVKHKDTKKNINIKFIISQINCKISTISIDNKNVLIKLISQ